MKIAFFDGRNFLLLGALATLAFACSEGSGSPGQSDGGKLQGDASVANDAGVKNGDGGSLPDIPEELQPLADGLAALAAGQPADLDGDGMIDFRTEEVDGKRLVKLVFWGSMTAITRTYLPNGDVELSGDLNFDGKVDYYGSSVLADDTLTEIHVWDLNNDQTDDLRRTVVFNPASGDRETKQMTITMERAKGDPPAFEVVSSYAGPAVAQVGDCSGMVTRPSSDGSSASPLGRPKIKVITNGEPGACSDSEARRLIDAFNKATSKGLACLRKANVESYMELAYSLANRPLEISCGNNCNLSNGQFSLAETDLPGSLRDVFGSPGMSFNMSKLGDDGCLASIMLHELMHWAGAPHEDDPTGNGGKDYVYSCARHCINCLGGGCGNGGGDKPADCAACRRGPKTKGKCGFQLERFVSDPCGVHCSNSDECGFATFGGDQPDCVYEGETFCDGTLADRYYPPLWCHLGCIDSGHSYPCGGLCTPDRQPGVVRPCEELPPEMCE